MLLFAQIYKLEAFSFSAHH